MAIGRIPEPLAGVQESLFTTKGDLVVATGPSQVVRQGVGTNNQVLMADSVQADGVKWANEATATLTAKGDILTATGANTLARLAVGTNGHTLVADSSASTGLKWAAPASSSPASARASSTGESATNSTSYTDTDPVLSVTLTTGTKALVLFSTELFNSGNNRNFVAIAVSGATTIAESDNTALFTAGTTQVRHSMAIMFNSLTAGSNTFTMKMKTNAGTISTQRRELIVIDLGS